MVSARGGELRLAIGSALATHHDRLRLGANRDLEMLVYVPWRTPQTMGALLRAPISEIGHFRRQFCGLFADWFAPPNRVFGLISAFFWYSFRYSFWVFGGFFQNPQDPRPPFSPFFCSKPAFFGDLGRFGRFWPFLKTQNQNGSPEAKTCVFRRFGLLFGVFQNLQKPKKPKKILKGESPSRMYVYAVWVRTYRVWHR